MALIPSLLYTIFAAVLHEFGHALVCLLFGLKVKRIGVSRKGFYTVREASADPRINAWIAAAGPMVNLLSAALWPIAPNFAQVSLILGICVLMPVKNSDGTKLLELWRVAPGELN
jgi:Zn-dependent protease